MNCDSTDCSHCCIGTVRHARAVAPVMFCNSLPLTRLFQGGGQVTCHNHNGINTGQIPLLLLSNVAALCNSFVLSL
jgi:hypothetical protein